MASKFDLEQIEAYLKHTLPPKERTQFEQSLKTNPDLASEVDAYQQLISGFNGLKSSDFSTNMGKWNQEWSDAEEEEDIELFLQGEAPPQLAAQLQRRMEKDAAFKAKVDQSQQLFSGLQGLQTQNFTQNLQNWEDQSSAKIITPQPKIRSLWPRLAAAASFLLLLGVGLHWFAQTNYSDDQLFESYYTPPKSENTLSGDAQALSQVAADFAQAHQRLQAGKASDAVQQFQQLLATLPQQNLDDFNKNYYTEQSEWNLLLAQLKAKNSKADVLTSLQKITNNPDHSFYSEAVQLENKLQSFWHTIGN